MKFLWQLLFVLLTMNGSAQRKIAMIIANGNYDEKKYGWSKINSLNDVSLLKQFFTKQEFDSIVIRRDLKKAEMLQCFTEFEKLVRRGDIAFIHISSHGQQVWDEDGDEFDGFDEAIVPVDCPAKPEYENATSKHFTDDELYKHIIRLRNKIGQKGTVVLTVDACNSGSVSRGLGPARGGQPPFIPNGKASKRDNVNTSEELFLSPDKLTPTSNASGFLLLTAAKPHELAHEHRVENKYYGSLSYAISQTITGIQKGASYRAWFSQIQNTMAGWNDVPNTPQIAGNVDMEIFGGKVIEQEPYFNIIGFEKRNPNKIVIDGGAVVGLIDSTKIWVLPSGSFRLDSALAIAVGYITKIENFTAEVVLDKTLELNSSKSWNKYWVFVAEKRLAFNKVKLFSPNQDIKAKLRSAIIDWTDQSNADLNIMLRKSITNRYAVIQNISGDTIVYSVGLDSLSFILDRYAKSIFLKNLNVSDPDTEIMIRLLPIKTDSGGKFLDTLPVNTVMKNGNYIFTPADTAILELTNATDRIVYFNILDIQPDGIINAVLPNEKKDFIAADLNLLPGRTVLLKKCIISFAPPYGKEIFKVFSSNVPINLEYIITSGGNLSRGNLSILEKVFASSLNVSTRGTVVENVPSGSGSAFNYAFQIAEKR